MGLVQLVMMIARVNIGEIKPRKLWLDHEGPALKKTKSKNNSERKTRQTYSSYDVRCPPFSAKETDVHHCESIKLRTKWVNQSQIELKL